MDIRGDPIDPIEETVTATALPRIFARRWTTGPGGTHVGAGALQTFPDGINNFEPIFYLPSTVAQWTNVYPANQGFSASPVTGGGILTESTVTRTYRIDVDISAVKNTQPGLATEQDCTFAIYHVDAFLYAPESFQTVTFYLSTKCHVHVHGYLTIGEEETVQVHVKNDTNTEALFIEYVHFSIESID